MKEPIEPTNGSPVKEVLDQLLAELLAEVRADYEQERRGIEIHRIIARVLSESFNGKKITRRLAAKVEASLEDSGLASSLGLDVENLSVNLSTACGNLCYVVVTDGRYIDRYCERFFVGYAESDLQAYDPNVFDERDASHGPAAVRRNAERAKLWDRWSEEYSSLCQLAEAIVARSKASTKIAKLIAHGAPCHQLQSSTWVKG